MIEPIYTTIGQNIRHRRLNAKLSQSDLAKVIGFRSWTSICDIEHGKARIQVHMLIELAAFFGMPLENFFLVKHVQCAFCHETKRGTDCTVIDSHHFCNRCCHVFVRAGNVLQSAQNGEVSR